LSVPYKTVEAGANTLSAADWNRAMEAAKRVLSSTDRSFHPTATQLNPNIIQVANKTGKTIPNRSILEVTSGTYDITGSMKELANVLTSQLYVGFKPYIPEQLDSEAPDNYGLSNIEEQVIVVTQQEAEPNDVVPAVINGVTQCRVALTSYRGETPLYAKALHQVTGRMERSTGGQAKVLFGHGREADSEDGKYIEWCTILLSPLQARMKKLISFRATEDLTTNDGRVNGVLITPYGEGVGFDEQTSSTHGEGESIQLINPPQQTSNVIENLNEGSFLFRMSEGQYGLAYHNGISSLNDEGVKRNEFVIIMVECPT